MKPLDAITQLVTLDENAVPEVAVVIVGFLDGNGDEGFKYHILGDSNLASCVGLLTIVQHDILRVME